MKCEIQMASNLSCCSQEKEEEKQKEEARWAAIPGWKQQLLKEKEKKLKEAEVGVITDILHTKVVTEAGFITSLVSGRCNR